MATLIETLNNVSYPDHNINPNSSTSLEELVKNMMHAEDMVKKCNDLIICVDQQLSNITHEQRTLMSKKNDLFCIINEYEHAIKAIRGEMCNRVRE